MIVFLRTLIIVYLLAINVFGFMLILTDKRKTTEQEENNLENESEKPTKTNNKKVGVKFSKLLFTAFLGGALGIYLSLFILKYKTNNLPLMIIMPLILVINVYALIFIFSYGFQVVMPSTI
jgi:uncharacterized membrane protein YsdA (DUF1294 family)